MNEVITQPAGTEQVGMATNAGLGPPAAGPDDLTQEGFMGALKRVSQKRPKSEPSSSET